MHIDDWRDGSHEAITYFYITSVKYFMIFMVAFLKMFLNSREICTDVVVQVLWKRRAEPDDVSFAIFGRFTFVFIFVI